MKPPPVIVRRLVVAPLVAVLGIVVLALSPLLLLAALIVDAFERRAFRTVRLTAFGLVYVALEIVAIVALFVLWIASGFGLAMRSDRMQRAHYAFMRWWVGMISRTARGLLGLRITIIGNPQGRPGPVLLFGRHAGLGNSLMLVGILMRHYQRRPRVVMLAALQWDPVIDMFGNRTPNSFITHDPAHSERFVATIGALAADMGDLDTLVLFPEGHDFTASLRLRAILHLRKEGHHRHADLAERLTNVLPPRHRGPLAAILAAPEADVAFVTHTVLEDIGTFAGMRQRVPFRQPVEAGYWRVPASEVPHEQDPCIDWLFEWWGRIDTWIDERRNAR